MRKIHVQIILLHILPNSTKMMKLNILENKTQNPKNQIKRKEEIELRIYNLVIKVHYQDCKSLQLNKNKESIVIQRING